MADPILLQNDWSRGMLRDYPRDQMPRGSAWDIRDALVNGYSTEGTWGTSSLQKRGGWTYASADLSAASASAASATWVTAVTSAPFAAGEQLLAIDEDGRLYKVVSSSSTTDLGSIGYTFCPPVFMNELVIVPNADGTTAPNKYNGSAISALSGSAPAANIATVYRNYLVLARNSSNPRRIFFGPLGDPTGTWNTSGAYLDANDTPKAMVTLGGVLLVFTNTRLERYRGDPPPATRDGVYDVLGTQSAVDATAVAVKDNLCYFGNPHGLFVTDGASITDLTSQTGMRGYWQDVFGAIEYADRMAMGFYGDDLVITAIASIGSPGAFQGCVVYNTDEKNWVRWTNMDCTMFAQSANGAHLYAGRRDDTRVIDVVDCFTPAASNKSDADGDAVDFQVETPFYQLSPPGLKRYKSVYVGYDLKDAATDNPSLYMSYTTSPEGSSYTAMHGDPAFQPPETSTYSRVRRRLNVRAPGIGFRIGVADPAKEARLLSIEVDAYAQERSRLA